ncbi:RNA-directed DNA polymerase, eukaryota [Tanacetum coccineum]
MSRLDRFLVTEGFFSLFPSISALCLDRHLSDHRPILLREVNTDFGPTPFRFYHSWFSFDGFDKMVEDAWLSFSHSDSNRLVRFKKKLQALKSIIRQWVKDKRLKLYNVKSSLKKELSIIDKDLDYGNVSDSVLLRRTELMSKLFDINQLENRDSIQKSKIQWAIEGDENSKFFHGIVNKKRSIMSIRGVFVDGSWCSDPSSVKDAFKRHFEARFKQPHGERLTLNFNFDKRLCTDQVEDLDRPVSRDEIRKAVWSCGENKSPGPDGFTFEFFRKYWLIVGADFAAAVEQFFDKGILPDGCNSSFIALIPKVPDAKFVTEFRPISLIGCVYKVITKVLANRLAMVISDLVSETQSAFVANRQILDGPFILNEVLNWCKMKRKQAMLFKVDFAKAYDSVRWDYLLDVLHAFGFGPNWCRWIRGSLGFAKASILVNGSPTSEFSFHCGLKQGDPLAPFLFILIMESLHFSFSRAVNDGLFKGLQLQGSVNISHLFYADDAMFIGEWSDSNLRGITSILKCFSLASGLNINIQKSQVMGVGVSSSIVEQAAGLIGCSVMNNSFRYLGVKVGECMSRKVAWDDTIHKFMSRLSKWKVKTLSIGGRLTLIKSVLGASPLYNMSIFKVPKGVLKILEAARCNFFNGADPLDRKITWVAWNKVLASKRKGGLGVSSLYALNRALLLKWAWRFISKDNSLWFQVIQALYGSKLEMHSLNQPSIWCSIIREVRLLKDKGFDFMSHCKKRVGDGRCTLFWEDLWITDVPLRVSFPRLYALEMNKLISVAEKLDAPISALSFRREVRGGIEQQQWSKLVELVGSVSLSSSPDRWFCDLSGDGVFTVKVVHNFLDDMLLPSHPVVTSWTKFIPIKVNIFSWRARRDCLPTRYNLSRRGVVLDSIVCGGIWIGWRFLPLRIGMFGSPQSVYRLLLNLCWKESLALLGGGFGRFAIGFFFYNSSPRRAVVFDEIVSSANGVSRFEVEYWANYDNDEDPIPFRRQVFPSSLDGILQLVFLGVEGRRIIPDWILRLANDRVGWDKYPWGSRYPRAAAWSKKGRFLRRMVVDFFHGNLLVARLTPDDTEARSDWWVSSRAYFDGVIDQAERVPRFLNRQNMFEVPSDFYRDFEQQKRDLEQQKKILRK